MGWLRIFTQHCCIVPSTTIYTHKEFPLFNLTSWSLKFSTHWLWKNKRLSAVQGGLWCILMMKKHNTPPFPYSHSHNTWPHQQMASFWWDLKGISWMDSSLIIYSHKPMRTTHRSQTGTLSNHKEKTQCQWNLSSPHEDWQTRTHIHVLWIKTELVQLPPTSRLSL